MSVPLFIIDAVSEDMKKPPVCTGGFCLFEKGQKADEGRFFRVTGADREEADNVQYKHGNGGNSDGDPAENRNESADRGDQYEAHLNFQSLTDVESCIR